MMKFRLTHPALKTSICVERVMGIEPTYQAWEARVLPLNYTRIAMRWPSKGWVAGFVKRAVWGSSGPGGLVETFQVKGTPGGVREDFKAGRFNAQASMTRECPKARRSSSSPHGWRQLSSLVPGRFMGHWLPGPWSFQYRSQLVSCAFPWDTPAERAWIYCRPGVSVLAPAPSNSSSARS